MNGLLLLAAIIASIYAYTYSRWLRQNGNTVGAFGVFLMAALSLALTIYRMLRAG